MKKIFGLLLLGILLVLSSCEENEADYFNRSNTSVMFDSKAATTIGEKGGTYALPIVLAGLPGGESVEVKVEIDVANSSAKEGVDFILKNKSLKFTDGFGIQNLEFDILDNELYTGDKSFVVKISDVNGALKGALTEVVVYIVDDEHPLAIVLGNYTAGDYLLEDNSLDGSNYSVAISSIPGSETKVTISNFWGGGKDIVAEVDLEAGTVTILPGQTIYVHSTYGNVIAVYVDSQAGSWNASDPILGTITETGIQFNAWGAKVPAGFFGVYAATILEKQ